MDTDAMRQFNLELSTLFDSKNLSKNKIQDISKAAIKAHKQYKHVVFAVEKLITKSKPEQRLTVLYVVDSIVRASKNQLKEKDTFGPRFLKQFDKFLDPLLKCGSKEKLRVIRTLNLWMSNKVYSEIEVQPFRDKCKKAGLIIDIEKVERAVKGKNADMSIYSGVYKKRKSTHKAQSPSHVHQDDGLLGAGPSSSMKAGPEIPNFVLSEEHVDGTISEREMLEMVQKYGIDRNGALIKDRALLQKVLNIFVESLTQKISEVQSEKNAKNGNSIQNVLTKDFEYSDDEEEKEKEPEVAEQKKLNHNEILGLAQILFTQPAVLSKITEVFAPTPTPVNPFGLPLMNENMIPTSSAALTLGAPPNLLALQQGLQPGFINQQLSLPNLPGINAQLLNSQGAQALLMQQRAAQLQAFQNVPQSQRSFLMLPNPLLHGFALQPGVNPLLNEMQAAAAQHQAQMNEIESPEKKLAEAVNNNDVDRARKEKEREKENKERKKMGLPPIKFGKTIIASRTLWLKKIPANVVENDLKQAVESCGEASRVKVIGNRACAFITMETRKAANEVVQKLREVSVAKKMVKVYWGRSAGLDSDQFVDLWDSDRGVWEIPFEKLPTDLVAFCEGAMLDLESLPEDKKLLYKENGESVLAAPPPTAPPPVPQPPPLGFPFHPQLGLPSQPRPPALPPGVPPMFQFNLNAPPPPNMQGIPGFPPAPPPPGVGAPQAVPPPGFDPNKPPPMFQQGFNPNAPPPPFGRGAGPLPSFPPRGAMHVPPPSFRGGRGNGPPHFDSPRRGAPFRPENGRGRLLDQSEMWSREREQRGRERDHDRDHDRSQFDRRRNDDGPRRRSRWGDDDRQDGRHDDRHNDRREPRRRSRSPERRQRRSPSYERGEEPARGNVSAEEATVSSTTLDEQKEASSIAEVVAEPVADQQEPETPKEAEVAVENHEDKTDEVPMDLE
uniref:CID domain-containing protein n=1 Tax=Caenorhabditis tropicalis TaxID=1561998 RepID=A0A1I7T7R2_9PELO